MFREKIPGKQLSAWLFAAVTPPLIQLTAGMRWHDIIIAAVGCLLATYVCLRWGADSDNRLLNVIRFLFLGALIGTLSANTAGSWPVGNNAPAVPLILLAVAAWAALKGPAAAARVGCVLFWLILLVYLIVIGVGVTEIDARWLCPPNGKMNWLGVVLLLTPATGLLVKQGRTFGQQLILMPVFVLTAAVICTGVLSPNLIEKMEDPFYQMSRSLNLLGVARRFEAIISAAMTVGWFSLLSLYLTLCGVLADRIQDGCGRVGVLVAAGIAAAMLLCDLHIVPIIAATSAAVFWVVIPMVTQGIESIKKSKKSEKEA